jgi:hypothetical protein
MSKRIGDTLPAEVLEALDGRDLAAKVGPAHLLLTGDEDGTPRPCMLSAGELLAADEKSLRFALWPGTQTVANLEQGRPAIFCYVAPGTVLYVRGRVRPLPDAELRNFELIVESVESDGHAGMPVTTGISFAIERGDPADVVAAWERQLAPLRGGG